MIIIKTAIVNVIKSRPIVIAAIGGGTMYIGMSALMVFALLYYVLNGITTTIDPAEYVISMTPAIIASCLFTILGAAMVASADHYNTIQRKV